MMRALFIFSSDRQRSPHEHQLVAPSNIHSHLPVCQPYRFACKQIPYQKNGSYKDHAFDPDVFTMRRCLPIHNRRVSTPSLASNFTTSYPLSPTAETDELRTFQVAFDCCDSHTRPAKRNSPRALKWTLYSKTTVSQPVVDGVPRSP